MRVKVIGYTYESDTHCPACAYRRFGPHPHQSVPLPGITDEHGIPETAVDRDGNPVHPIFDTDAGAQDAVCCDCGANLLDS